MKVVVVESPAKAKTINKYLGGEYIVLASYGHVRDLPPKDGSVRPDENFAMDWDVNPDGDKRIKDIARALKNADSLILATDPDREGEAISWHVREELDRRRALGSRHVERVVFHEITKSAVLDAIAHPRELNQELVEAYLARRALDYLVGFTLSPILWRKLPGSRSAGRVQSVALRLICQRENEIESFVPQEYWSIEASCLTAAGKPFTARISQWQGKRLDRLAITDKAMADEIVKVLDAAAYKIDSVEKRQVRRNPPPPFTTSTLQQEASRKLRFAASQTMRIAQKLYEGIELGGETTGLITYMRTDSVNLSNEALSQARELIAKRYDAPYLPDKPRLFQNKAKNAQEAHEAIRPTDMARDPASLKGYLEPQQLALYELVWKRTLAGQMANAVLDQVTVDIATADKQAVLRAVGTTIRFDGFLTLYQEDVDDPADDKDEGRLLPPMAEGETVTTDKITPEQHFTQPPPRFTEASLVKRLEELGIGRPSTYASILQVLQDRQYVTLDRRRFKAEDRGRLVTAFLENYFQRYVQYDFTADLEQSLDDVSNGDRDWRELLREFWDSFFTRVEETKDLTIRQVIDVLDEDLGRHFFPPGEEGSEPRKCPACGGDGRLGLRLSRTGAFIGCSNYPDCNYTRALAVPGEDDEVALPKTLGIDPDSGLEVSLRKGPYGLYVQLGDATEEDKKPKRASLLRGTPIDDVDLQMALALLALPREIGLHPESGQPISAAIGRYGPYIAHDKKFVSLKGDDDVLSIGLNRAVSLLAEAKGGGQGLLRELGEHPDDGKPITLNRGRFGPYVKHGKTMASLRKANDPETMTIAEALELIAAKVERAAGGKGKAAAAKKAPAAKKATVKKPAAKKPPAKKAVPKKAAAKKAAE